MRHYKKFNEPYVGDLRHLVTRIVEDRLRPENRANVEALMSEQHREMVANVTGLYCLTTKPDNLLMWAHYGNNHSGVCLEFSGDILNEVGSAPMKVLYAQQRKPMEMYRFQPDKLEISHCTKSFHWEYEDEWRLIRPDYEGGKGVVKFAPRLLTGIIIGAMASSETIDIVTGWASERSEPLVLSQSRLSKKEFSLEIVPFN